MNTDKLVIVYLADKRQRFDPCGWYRFDCLIASLKCVTLFMPPTDIIVFHEDFSDDDIAMLALLSPRIRCVKIDMETHRGVYVNRRPDSHTGAYGYHMMCRFFSGVMQARPELEPYTHYMRLDDDSYLVAPVPDDFLADAMARDYTYAATSEEDWRPLYDMACAYAGEVNFPAPEYRRSVIYNNFHISSLKMWKYPAIKRFTDQIEAVNGCIAHGFTDAPIHTLAAMWLGPRTFVHVAQDTRIGYRHNQHCAHPYRPHTQFCRDGHNDKYPWGPPAVLGGLGWRQAP